MGTRRRTGEPVTRHRDKATTTELPAPERARGLVIDLKDRELPSERRLSPVIERALDSVHVESQVNADRPYTEQGLLNTGRPAIVVTAAARWRLVDRKGTRGVRNTAAVLTSLVTVADRIAGRGADAAKTDVPFGAGRGALRGVV
jgi:hypothetical protein